MIGIIDSNQKIVTSGLLLHLDAAQLRSYAGTGTTWWADVSGNNRNGTFQNGTAFDSSNGGNILFDALNDFVSFDTTNFGNTFTFLAFIRPSSTATIQTIFSNRAWTDTAGGSVQSSGIAFHINDRNVNDRRLQLMLANGSSGVSPVSVGAITYDTWQQVGVTCTSSGSGTMLTTTLYKNGASLNTSGGVDPGHTRNAAWRLGYMTGNTFPFNGRMGQVLLYNRVLSAAEILQNYNAIKSRYGL